MEWNKTTTVAALFGIFVGCAIGFGVTLQYMQGKQNSFFNAFHSVRRTEEPFKLIHPLVAYETPEATTFSEYQELKSRLERVISGFKFEGAARDVSIYYRNQETGEWIGINQNTYYYPASLLKVPVMIAYFKRAESERDLLKKNVRYTPISGGDPFEAPSSLTPGKYYSVRELIERMIVESDNGATYTLIDAIDPETLNEVYSDLGITHPGDDSSRYQISTKTYALFFRVLYNSTYLTPIHSEEALELLSRSTFREGLAAGIPEGMQIAHKFGEHVVSADRQTVDGVELHDCGITYYPNHPYLLCIMTRATSLSNASRIISTISKEVYTAVKADVDERS